MEVTKQGNEALENIKSEILSQITTALVAIMKGLVHDSRADKDESF